MAAPLARRLLTLVLLPLALRAEPALVYAAADIADCSRRPADESVAAATARLVPDGATVLVAGDAVYDRATPERLESCYEPTWGRHRLHTLAVPGNHDYVDGRADAFLGYFGAASGGGPDGTFARRLGPWLLIGLDSNASAAGLDRQYAWLEAGLEANRDASCVVALWHHPLFSSGLHRGSGRQMQRFWELLDGHGADLVLSGHEHFYERFEPRRADGERARSAPRQFVVGTGGARLFGFWRPPYRSSARILRHGVLELRLDDASYAWRFLGTDGRVHDAGTAACRRPAPH